MTIAFKSNGEESYSISCPSSSGKNEEGLVRAAAIIEFPELAREMGLSPEAILVQHGLSLEALRNTENILPLSAINKLLQQAADASDCQHFGLLLGERQDPSVLGMLLMMMQQMETIGDAFEIIQQHFHKHNIGANFSIQQYGDLAELTYEIWLPNPHLQTQGLSLALATMSNLMTVLAGKKWQPTEVHFSFSKPNNTLPYARFFNSPVYFEQDKSCIYFPAEWLKAPVIGHNPMFQQIIDNYLKTECPPVNMSWTLQVECLIRTLMPQGQANIKHVSKSFGVSRRTLHRRLSSEGTTFEEILQDVRFTVVDQLLGRPELTLLEIALMAGFSDSSAFSRAYSNRYKIPPKKRREKLLMKETKVVQILHKTLHRQPIEQFFHDPSYI